LHPPFGDAVETCPSVVTAGLRSMRIRAGTRKLRESSTPSNRNIPVAIQRSVWTGRVEAAFVSAVKVGGRAGFEKCCHSG